MSLFEFPAMTDQPARRRRASRMGFVGVILTCLTLTACGATVEPLYGTNSSASAYGGSVSNQLAAVDVEVQSTRAAQKLRNELVFKLGQGRTPSGPDVEQYALAMRVTERNSGFLLGRVAGRPTGRTFTMRVSYTLKASESGDVLTNGTVERVASYDITDQTFAADRAEIDAENRAAVEVADSIRTELAAYFAGVQ